MRSGGGSCRAGARSVWTDPIWTRWVGSSVAAGDQAVLDTHAVEGARRLAEKFAAMDEPPADEAALR
jgi:hypothetical protein